jgi:hypothetical protein
MAMIPSRIRPSVETGFRRLDRSMMILRTARSSPPRTGASVDGRPRRHPVKKRPRRRRARREAQPEASYVCDSCGEEIVVPVDVSAGCSQDYVEDCPVCCHPMRLQVTIDEDGSARIEGEHE